MDEQTGFVCALKIRIERTFISMRQSLLLVALINKALSYIFMNEGNMKAINDAADKRQEAK